MSPRHRVMLVAAVVLLIQVRSVSQERRQTDAQQDDLAGPVKSVATMVVQSGVQWEQPDGPTLFFPVSCRDCEYDPDGAKTRAGTIGETSFFGENLQIDRDGKGKVIERRVIDATTGELTRDDVLGTHGITRQTAYNHGVVSSSQRFHYDEKGHLSEILSLDAKGNQSDRTNYTTTEDGVTTETTQWGQAGQMRFQQLYDPETDTDTITTFDDAGAIKLFLLAVQGRVTSFWARSSERQFGDSIAFFKGGGNAESTHCHADGKCDRFLIHYEYSDHPQRNPGSAEWRDASGNLLYAVYYEYEMDQYRNWTHRKVWVIGPNQPERSLYEEDSRIIVYW